MCFTSPPYGAGNVAKLRDHYVPGAAKRKSFYDKHEDDPDSWPKLMSGWYDAVRPFVQCFGWWFFLSTMLLRKFLFDTALNLYNGRAIFFVSKETTSIIDRVHYWAFGIHSEIYQVAYAAAWFILIIKFAR